MPVIDEGTVAVGPGSVRFDSGLDMGPSSQVKVSVGPSFAGGMPVSGGAVVGGELTVITEAGFELWSEQKGSGVVAGRRVWMVVHGVRCNSGPYAELGALGVGGPVLADGRTGGDTSRRFRW